MLGTPMTSGPIIAFSFHSHSKVNSYRPHVLPHGWSVRIELTGLMRGRLLLIQSIPSRERERISSIVVYVKVGHSGNVYGIRNILRFDFAMRDVAAPKFLPRGRKADKIVFR